MDGQIALRSHRDAGPDLADICASETGIDTDREDIGMLFIGTCALQSFDHGADVRASTIDLVDHRQMRPHDHRTDLAGHGSVQDAAGLGSGATHVHMRIGLVGHQDVGMPAHRAAHVGMQIQCDGDRHVGTDDSAQACQQLAFTVVAEVGHHGTMQAEQNAVKSLFVFPRRGHDGVGQPFERIAGDRTRRLCDG